MRNSGRSSDGGGGRVMQRINVLSHQALRSLDRGEVNQAYEKLLLIRQLSNN